MLYPVALTAATDTVYGTPFVSPVMVSGDADPVTARPRPVTPPEAWESTGQTVAR
jgi:hypothetical protein